MIIFIAIFISGMIAYQADKPCDQACFDKKIQEQSKPTTEARKANQNDITREMMRDRR